MAILLLWHNGWLELCVHWFLTLVKRSDPRLHGPVSELQHTQHRMCAPSPVSVRMSTECAFDACFTAKCCLCCRCTGLVHGGHAAPRGTGHHHARHGHLWTHHLRLLLPLLCLRLLTAGASPGRYLCHHHFCTAGCAVGQAARRAVSGKLQGVAHAIAGMALVAAEISWDGIYVFTRLPGR